MGNVAKITTYVVGLKSDDRIWIGEMVKKHFPVPPAHTLVGISALAAPELLVEGVIDYLRQKGFDSVEEDEAIVENVHFNLPSELTRAVAETNRARPMPVP